MKSFLHKSICSLRVVFTVNVSNEILINYLRSTIVQIDDVANYTKWSHKIDIIILIVLSRMRNCGSED